jgi:hypothetical protein
MVFTFLKLADKSKHVLLQVIFTSDLPFRRHRDRKGYSPKIFVGRTVFGLPFSQFCSIVTILTFLKFAAHALEL